MHSAIPAIPSSLLPHAHHSLTLAISAHQDWLLLLIDTYLAFPVQTPYREMQTNPDPLFSPEHVHHKPETSLYIDHMGTLPTFSPNSGQNFN